MPTVNTLVVERADLLGLGQLHQLRGRVGRSGQRAYAYLFHPADVAAHRGGVRAAEDDRRGDRPRQRVQDRDARPGDPRGRQPARRGAVGPHRRRRLRPLLPDGDRGRGGDEGRDAGRAGRDQARRADRCLPARRLRHRTKSRGSRPTAGWPPSPADAEVDDIRAEWEDRYGPVPEAAEALLWVGRLRAECHRLGVHDVTIAGNQARLAPLPLTFSQTTRLRRLSRGDLEGGCPAAGRADQARRRPGPVPRRLPGRAGAPAGGRGDRVTRSVSSGGAGRVDRFCAVTSLHGPRALRRLAAGAVVLAIASSLADRPAAAADDAATADGTAISVDELDDTIEAFAGQGVLGLSIDPETSTVGADGARTTLTVLIQNVLSAGLLDSLGRRAARRQRPRREVPVARRQPASVRRARRPRPAGRHRQPRAVRPARRDHGRRSR